MRNLSVLILIGIICFNCYTQESVAQKERDWLIEVEPAAFVLGGFGFQFGRNLTKDNKLSTSFYSVATDVPEAIKSRMFSNTVAEDELRLSFQLALNTRYKIELFKNRASNPYVGLVTGWEYFDLKNEAKQDLRIEVFLFTPYIGAEIYVYKNILYINPQLRSVFYINPKYSIENRDETINNPFILPQISIGVRL